MDVQAGYEAHHFGVPYAYDPLPAHKVRSPEINLFLRYMLSVDETVRQDYALRLLPLPGPAVSILLPLDPRAQDSFTPLVMPARARRALSHNLASLRLGYEVRIAQLLALIAGSAPDARNLCGTLGLGLNLKVPERSFMHIVVSDDRLLELADWRIDADCPALGRSTILNYDYEAIDDKPWQPVIEAAFERYDEEMRRFLCCTKLAMMEGLAGRKVLGCFL
jgi:hypothetical protein